MTPPDQETRDAAKDDWCRYGEKIQMLGEANLLDVKLLAEKSFISGAAYVQERILKLLRDFKGGDEWADTAPHAICLAALKAVGVDIESEPTKLESTDVALPRG